LAVFHTWLLSAAPGRLSPRRVRSRRTPAESIGTLTTKETGMRTAQSGLFALMLAAALAAQSPGPAPAAYMSAADIGKGLAAAVAADAAAGAAVTIAPNVMVRRRSGAGEPQYAIVHPF